MLSDKVKIQFLFFEGCPSHEQGLLRLEKVLREESVNAQIEIIEVVSEKQAAELGFIGSPTILVNGGDIDPHGLDGQIPALTCRVYRLADGRFSPLPPESMIRKALHR